MKTSIRQQWEQELAGWGPDNQAIFAEMLEQRRRDFPNEGDWSWVVTFRTMRDLLLRQGHMGLESVPAWGRTGPARSDEQIKALKNDDSAERLRKEQEFQQQKAEWARRREDAA